MLTRDRLVAGRLLSHWYRRMEFDRHFIMHLTILTWHHMGEGGANVKNAHTIFHSQAQHQHTHTRVRCESAPGLSQADRKKMSKGKKPGALLSSSRVSRPLSLSFSFFPFASPLSPAFFLLSFSSSASIHFSYSFFGEHTSPHVCDKMGVYAGTMRELREISKSQQFSIAVKSGRFQLPDRRIRHAHSVRPCVCVCVCAVYQMTKCEKRSKKKP